MVIVIIIIIIIIIITIIKFQTQRFYKQIFRTKVTLKKTGSNMLFYYLGKRIKGMKCRVKLRF